MHIIRAPLGGAFRHVRDLVRAQLQCGMAVALVCSSRHYDLDSERQLEELMSLCSAGAWRIPIPRTVGINDIRAVYKILRICSEQSPVDILHGHGAKGSAYARIVAQRLPAVAICTPHGGALHYSSKTPSGIFFLSLERLLRLKTGGMIFESEYARRSYEVKVGKAQFPYVVIYNGLHDAEFLPVRRDEATYDFLFVGEFRTIKGIYVLLDAVQILSKRAKFKLLFVGSGPEQTKLTEQIDRNDLNQFVDVVPPIHPARQAFQFGRYLIVPSLKESFPYIVLEALAAKMPLLATRVGGIPEIYGAKSDQLIPAANPTVLAERMFEMMTSPDTSQTMAKILHDHIATHMRAARMVEEVNKFYRSCLRCTTTVHS